MERQTRQQTRQQWWMRILLGVILVLVIGTALVFNRAIHPYAKLRSDAELVAAKRAQASNFDGFWWNTRDKSYVTLSATRKNQPVYVVIAQKTGKVNVVLKDRGTTRNAILQKTWARYQPKRVLNAGLRMHKNKLVWDVGFVARNGRLGYASYDYRSGRLLSVIRDL
ncbi:hypothetical protein PQ472_06120 [Lacticaseibacillus pabuli]|uniref:DUF5590 domain-containing protein n=1 Tax=Lacticaseibacillus pabuli TaxID=3025672 RepID=A0ABY7WNY2_9LACO|nr:hypothetical protein [Lacticaseibacillus sp. KACC 23028]WDF81514.1 hypothetical protein PQ472_06120 [Lacticaseibacillus sp. KACC 23028]